MSQLISFDAACTFCQHPNEAEVWSSLNVKTDPELKDMLLGGELNMIECAACKEIFYAEHFLLYHDPDSELLAFVYPHDYAAEKEKWELKTQADFAQTQLASSDEAKLNYEPITLFGLDQLLFLVEDEEEMMIQSEIADLLALGTDFKVRRMRPAEARHRKLPVALPYIEGPGLSPREAVLGGLGKLIAANDRLTVFSTLQSQLLADPSADVGPNF